MIGKSYILIVYDEYEAGAGPITFLDKMMQHKNKEEKMFVDMLAMQEKKKGSYKRSFWIGLMTLLLGVTALVLLAAGILEEGWYSIIGLTVHTLSVIFFFFSIVKTIYARHYWWIASSILLFIINLMTAFAGFFTVLIFLGYL